MGINEGSPDFDATRAELFEAISHPVRIKILQALSEKPMGFAQLGRAVGIESGGHLSFHLNKLRHLVKVAPDGNYVLTADGKEALWSVNALRKASSGIAATSGRAVKHRSLVRPVLALVVISVIVLGGAISYMQAEYSSQQQQLQSQREVIGALQNGLPFVNGQNASLVIGQPNFATYQPSATYSPGEFHNPSNIAFDSSGDMWVADYGGFRVLEFKPAPFFTGMNASLVIGQKNFTSGAPSLTRDGLGQDCHRDSPCGPGGVTFDAYGDLWVTDYGANRVLEYKPPFSNGMNASIVIGEKDFTSGGNYLHVSGVAGRASAGVLFTPVNVAFDSFNDLWVLDSGDNRVLQFRPPFIDGENASMVLGQSNFTNTSPSSGRNGLNCRFGSMALDGYGDVWVGDIFNNRLVEFKPPFSNGMNASLIISQQNIRLPSQQQTGIFGGFSGNLGWLVSFDQQGNLWAASNDRLLAFKPPFTTGINSFPQLEIGQPNFTATAWSGGRNGFSTAYGGVSGIAFDSSGNLWAADGGNNRVLEFAAGSTTQGSSRGLLPALTPLQLQAVAAGGAALVIGVALVLKVARRRNHRRPKGGSNSTS